MNVQQKAMQADPSADSDGTEHYRPALDLTVYHKIIPRGDVLVYCTWLRRGGQWEACLVLVPRRTVLSVERVVPCVVPLSRAHVWAEETGNLKDCLINAGYFCANLGFNPANPRNPLKIIGIIRDCLHDLLTTPPRWDDAPREITADMEVIDNATGKVTELEVSDDDGTL